MNENTHTPEPWRVEKRMDADGGAVGWDIIAPAGVIGTCWAGEGIDAEANANRIVACVGACEGLLWYSLHRKVATVWAKMVKESIDRMEYEVGGGGAKEELRDIVGDIRTALRILKDKP